MKILFLNLSQRKINNNRAATEEGGEEEDGDRGGGTSTATAPPTPVRLGFSIEVLNEVTISIVGV